MEKLSFYEQVGIVIPGAVFMFGLMFYLPQLKDLFAKDAVTIGGLGLFVLVAYAAGHILAAVGNILEGIYWKMRGSIPSGWIVGKTPRLLSKVQIKKIHSLACVRFQTELDPIENYTSKDSIFRQIYSDVEAHGKPQRAEAFNGNYGLNRGLCAATLAVGVIAALHQPRQWWISLALLAASLTYLYRMHRFGVHYARETYSQFLLLPSEPPKTTTPEAKSGND